ncbi:hypothetical protein C8A00DRAFT_36482 [Chaetomidium leptoderma]|uniref:Uncharacterized protein n=1 Tax=Chaetomidium leptoderma TaxID=669021 RepID=A0AAN6ZW03_9PEZI|nr:hypothetical protein C8A00DRAFT_36482 [Chaetomidium leptoderma]
MPPKPAAGTGPGRAKKSRLSTDADGSDGDDTRSKRWSPVSGSANLDMVYKRDTRNPVSAYNFLCMCRPPFYNGENLGRKAQDGDDEDDEDDEGDEENKENAQGEEGETSEKSDMPPKQAKCDAGDTCLCNDAASEHPDHVWKLSFAGKRKFETQRLHAQLRCPDYFDMYTFNRHGAYGMLELLQNLILDFDEAAANYKEQWAVCEGLAFFLHTEDAWQVNRVDGNTVGETYLLLGRLFMSMLARLERERLLARDSAIKNLGLIMALFMDFARKARRMSQLSSSSRQSLLPAKSKKKWAPHAFDDHIFAYARKYDIDLVGPYKIDEILANADGDVDLPAPEHNTGKADPFNFTRNLKRYKEEQGGITGWMVFTVNPLTPIGGDCLDITSWTSDARKAKHFDEKDPLTKEQIDALKDGGVLMVV